MWERFTERARRVIFFAQEEAERLGGSYVSTEHILLGIVRENDSVAARILDRIGISLSSIRTEIERQIPKDEARLVQDLQLTPRGKKVIDLAYDEARQLSNNYIGTEHLLLGLICEGEGLAGRVLNRRGVDLEATRKVLLALQDSGAKKGKGMWQRFTERARRVVFFAQEEAGRFGENYVSTEHLLLGLIRENDSVAARILDRMGVPLGRIRSEIERQLTHGEGRLGQDMQLTPRAKRVIDLAYDEARQLSNNYIGTEHLLLGLIREGEGLAGRVLAKLAVDLEKTRYEVKLLQDNDSGKPIQRATENIETLRQEVLSEMSAHKKTADTIYAEVGYEKAGHVLEAIQGKVSIWRGKSLLSMDGVDASQVSLILDTAALLKTMHSRRRAHLVFGYPATLALLFEKPSLRTRTSFEAGMAHLGGHAIYLAPSDVGLGTRESVPDVAGALSRWVDIIAARVFDHSTVETLAAHATVPVINALSDREHPLQMFADMLTMKEIKNALDSSIKLTYVGDGNNVLNSLMLTCATLGINLTAACPDGYLPDPYFLSKSQEIAAGTGAIVELIGDPVAAVKDANFVYTDVWTSMGHEAESDKRRKLFAPYAVTTQLMDAARPDAIALHCMPAHCGEEISEQVMEKFRTIILNQAENRMHTQKALVLQILGL